MDKLFAFIAYQVTTIIAGVLVLLLLTHIVIDVAHLYEVAFITNLSYSSILGGILIYRYFVRIKGVKKKDLQATFKEEDKSTPAQNFGYSMLNAFIITMGLLIGWAIAYLIHLFI